MSPVPSPAASRLYLVAPARPDLAELIEAAVRGGVDIVQIREKELPDGGLLGLLHLYPSLSPRFLFRGEPPLGNDFACMGSGRIHDLTFWFYPELCTPQVRRYRWIVPKVLKRCAAMLVPSQTIREQAAAEHSGAAPLCSRRLGIAVQVHLAKSS